jgi:hypothetical protein
MTSFADKHTLAKFSKEGRNPDMVPDLGWSPVESTLKPFGEVLARLSGIEWRE